MTDSSRPTSRSEQRLLTLLALLNQDEVQGDPQLARLVVQTLRWQIVLRSMLRAGGTVLGSIGTAFSLLAHRPNNERPHQ